jgi:hypothetical protein
MTQTQRGRENIPADSFVIMPNDTHVFPFNKGQVGATRRVAPTSVSLSLGPNSLDSIIGQI